MTHPFDLTARARKAMSDARFSPDFPDDVLREVDEINAGPPHASGIVQDARDRLWSSIDNIASRDLDQVEMVEALSETTARLFIGIADVDALVPQGSALDRWAAQQTTSVYTGVRTFPLLPDRLSAHLTSLVQDQDRLGLITSVLIGEDGDARAEGVTRAVLRNHARLDYDSVADWLTRPDAISNALADPAMAVQLRLQEKVSQRLHAWRRKTGALEFDTIEASPVVADGTITGLAVQAKNEARSMIENFMVAANSAISEILRRRNFPSLQRVVRTPARWNRIVQIAASLGDALPAEASAPALAAFLARRKAADPERFSDLSLSVVKLLGPGEYAVVGAGREPEGHFGLAVHGYTHSTAPNRRYPDLVTQRLLKAALEDRPAPYTETELDAIARHCNERGEAARKVERLMRKVAAALFLGGHIGETCAAIVTGASPKGVYVRLIAPPVEGRLVRGEAGLDVGDAVDVRLLSVDPMQGFIDFGRA